MAILFHNDDEGDRFATVQDNLVQDSPAKDNALRLHPESCDSAAVDRQLEGWIARIVHQDQEAFAALYQAAVGQVYSLTLRITGDASMAEEATEDTFWQIWRQAPRFDQKRGRAMAWILIIARTRALDARRRRIPKELELGLDCLDTFEPHQTVGPLDSMELELRQRQLKDALAGLDPAQRQLMALVYFRGLTHEEIAQFTSLPLGTVKANLRRSLLRLRDFLATEGNAADINLNM